LAAQREYALCATYVPDVEARFDEIRQMFQIKMEIADENATLRAGGIRGYAVFSLVSEITRLVEILSGAGRSQEAEKLRELALALNVSADARDALERALGQQRPGT
jgi:hypothetical protein